MKTPHISLSMNKGVLDLFFDILDLEGGFSDLEHDRGGKTMYGVSSVAWREDYDRMAANGWSKDEVFMFYYNRFFLRLYRFHELLNKRPHITTLLVAGFVHGVAGHHYTRIIQKTSGSLTVDGRFGKRTATWLLDCTDEQYIHTLNEINNQIDHLIELRQKAVGAYPRGIANRVYREFKKAGLPTLRNVA